MGLVSVAMSTITCEEGQVYVAVTKKCTTDAAEESYVILNGSEELVTSQRFANNELRTNEYCLPATPNSQYTFRMVDSYASRGDSWASGAWASVAGIYGNVVFKGFMVEKKNENFALSLYYPVMKTQEWKTFASTSSIASNWNTVGFGDSSWTAATMGSALAMTGTQYFRKTFTGIDNMAAYEYRFNYRYGIIAYVNGNEIFRDHMEEGTVTPTTTSSGAYNNYEYHGVIRPAPEVTVGNNVLAVELHYPTAGENAVEFDAFVAALASSTPVTDTDKCFVYPYATTVTGGGTNPARAADWAKANYMTVSRTKLPVTLTYDLSGPPALFNGVRIWPSGSPAKCPGSFSLSGTASSGAWFPILSVADTSYTSNKYKSFSTSFAQKVYSSYRLDITAIAGESFLYVYEAQMLVCNTPLPTSLTFEPASYSHFAYYQEVNIRPTMRELSNCNIQPALPAGLSLDSATCTVSGKATVGLTTTTFTMTSVMGAASIPGTFTLQISECSSTLVKFLRTYKGSANYETFTVKDQASQEVVLSVSSGQTANQDWSTILCLSGSKYEIDVDSTNYDYWQAKSFLYVDALLLDEEYETIARVRYDAVLGLGTDRIFNAQWAVAPSSMWQYKMGSVPANWLTESGWQTASMGSFPASTNQIQLYKKTFTVASLEDVAGFVISLRYLYGCVIYLNGVEVFRNGVTGALSASSTGLNAYTDLLYHQISLPVKTLVTEDTEAVQYLQQGSNVIAVAIVGQTASQTSSVFDCAVRLVGTTYASRVFNSDISASVISGSKTEVTEHYHVTKMNAITCTPNNWMVTFKNDRREWLSSITLYLYYQQGDQQPRQFTLKARNNNQESWTTLQEVRGMTWSLVGEHKKIWIENDKPYNQYRLENIATGDDTKCEWYLSGIDFGMDAFPAAIPELSYSTPIVLNKNVEMGEVYPNSDYYFDFAITPVLPAGLSLDPTTGKISGTARSEMAATPYTITAKKLGGGSTSTTITLSVEVCTGGKGFITLVALTDTWPYEGSYKLHSGRGVEGEVVQFNTGFRVKSGLNYGDFCMPHGLYTVEVCDASTDGWKNPAGWYLTVDLGAMIIEMNQMPSKVPSVTSVFSSLLPFQIEYDDWKLYNNEQQVAQGWNALDFDDDAWQSVKAAAMGNHMATTVYIRREVEVPSLEDYHVLNVRMKYAGGVVVYFNGRTVARFNLVEEFDRNTEATAPHDASLFSKFHVVLSTVGAVAGKNVMAFEVHRTADQSTIVFDATGVFGVNDCSVVLDTFSVIDASEVNGCTKEDLFDLNPSTFGSIPNEVGSFIEWTVENLEGSKWNAFGLQTNNAVTNFAFTIGGRWEKSEEYMEALAVSSQVTKNRERSLWNMPTGVAGFRQFRYEVESIATSKPSINAIVMQYCKPSSSGSCPAIGEYPSVGEGEISPAMCPDGFRGYSYRECHDSVLGDVKTDKCEYKVPSNLAYESNNLEFVMGTEVNSGVPTYRNLVTRFYMQESMPLPEGLTIDEKTGEIVGKPVQEMETGVYTVRAENPKGETYVTITISVRKGYCLPEGVFDGAHVGEVSVYECSKQGNYVGTQKRACVLGEKDGVWEQASGVCVSVVTIVIIVVVVIIVIAVVVLLIVRAARSKKAVGGVKGKKSTASKTTKAVKV